MINSKNSIFFCSVFIITLIFSTIVNGYIEERSERNSNIKEQLRQMREINTRAQQMKNNWELYENRKMVENEINRINEQMHIFNDKILIIKKAVYMHDSPKKEDLSKIYFKALLDGYKDALKAENTTHLEEI